MIYRLIYKTFSELNGAQIEKVQEYGNAIAKQYTDQLETTKDLGEEWKYEFNSVENCFTLNVVDAFGDRAIAEFYFKTTEEMFLILKQSEEVVHAFHNTETYLLFPNDNYSYTRWDVGFRNGSPIQKTLKGEKIDDSFWRRIENSLNRV